MASKRHKLYCHLLFPESPMQVSTDDSELRACAPGHAKRAGTRESGENSGGGLQFWAGVIMSQAGNDA